MAGAAPGLPEGVRFGLSLCGAATSPSSMTQESEAELAALKIILSNVVARLAIATTREGAIGVREMLAGMNDECKLTAEHTTLGRNSQERVKMVNQTLTHVDEFFKGITIT